jgi:hypothetical protein
MANDTIKTEVPPEEVARRIAEYRRFSFEGRLPPQVVYPSMQLCPWPGCGYRIAAIRFNLEHLVAPERYDDALFAWWQGPGLVARCPGCDQYVLFGVQEKRAIAAADLRDFFVLPDDWYETAYLVPMGESQKGK